MFDEKLQRWKKIKHKKDVAALTNKKMKGNSEQVENWSYKRDIV